MLEEYRAALARAGLGTTARLQSRALMLRVFLVSDGRGDYRVMPGGLSRIAGSEREMVSGQRGGGSKDTWVLSDAPVERFSLLPGRLRLHDIVRSERAVSSRAAEHLFWLGRYAERSENAARLLRAVLTRLPQGDASVSPALAPAALPPAGATTCCRSSATSAARVRAGVRARADPGHARSDAAHSLAFNVEQTVRAAGAVRDRLSSDNWGS